MNDTGFAKFHYPRLITTIKQIRGFHRTEDGHGLEPRFNWQCPLCKFHYHGRRNFKGIWDGIYAHLTGKHNIPESIILIQTADTKGGR